MRDEDADNARRRGRRRRFAITIVAVLATVLVLFAVTLALPVRIWRTGELRALPLPVVEGGPAVSMTGRVWIDTDPACGHSRMSDSDDCFALLLLARAKQVEIAGISTVFGNEPIEVTDRTARELVGVLNASGDPVAPVYRGSGRALAAGSEAAFEPAHAALRRALEEGPLTLVALGPMTNIALALKDRPDLQARVSRLVAVMGRRPGHLFHPSEGSGRGMLFGHGPVFRDLNFDKDPVAARAVLSMRLPTTLMPYEAARDLSLTAADLGVLGASGGGGAWTARRAGPWLGFWRDEVGRDGFYPFDLIAGAYAIMPGLFDCAEAAARVGSDDLLWNFWFYDPPALLVDPAYSLRGDPMASAPVVYCTTTRQRAHAVLMDVLAGRRADPR